MAALVATSAVAVTPVATFAAEDSLTVDARADSSVQRLRPSANYGGAQQLGVRAFRWHSYLKFDLSAWYGRQLSRIELQVRVNQGAAETLRLNLTGTRWSETTLTWENRPARLTAPTVSITSDGGVVRSAAEGMTSINVVPLFPGGTVDRRIVSIRLRSTSSTAVRLASRESSNPPRLVMWSPAVAEDGAVQSAASRLPLRFYTPNIIARGDNMSPPRDTSAEQMTRLFSSRSEMDPVLRRVDVYSFFGASIGRGDPAYEAMLARAIPMLESYNVKIGLEVGGPLGYAPGVVFGGDRGGENGRKSALFDIASRIGKIESLGGRVQYLMLDGALRRTIRNGIHKNPHTATVTIGTVANNNALTYRARVTGMAGNAIRVTYALQAPTSPLSVAVSGTEITVRLATDAAGRSVSTASQVKAAVESSVAAMALVSVSQYGASSGAGIIPPRAATGLNWGDDGLNMTIQESVAELVSYIRTINQARPEIRFVILEDVILWPYDGVAGYASIPYPSAQRPDFKVVWNEVVRSLRAAGLLKLLVGFHNDVPVEYLDREVPSINRNADDWYGRILKQQAQVEASGIAFGQLFNSLHGGTPGASILASDSYFQSQVLHHVTQLERYRRANRPNLARMDHFVIDAFMFYPRVISPSTREFSTDATYLKALELFLSGAQSSTGTAAAAVMSDPDQGLIAA